MNSHLRVSWSNEVMKNLACSVVTMALLAQAHATVVFDNIDPNSSPVSFLNSGIANVDTIVGDSMTLTHGGLINEIDVVLGDIGSGTISGFTIELSFYDSTLPYSTGPIGNFLPLLGQFSRNIEIPEGFASLTHKTFKFDNLENLGMMTGQKLLVVQRLSNIQGGGLFMGVGFYAAPIIGTGNFNKTYIKTFNFEGISSGMFGGDVAYRVHVVPEPATSLSVGGVLALLARRNRARSNAAKN
jgi:hypothetical protein